MKHKVVRFMNLCLLCALLVSLLSISAMATGETVSVTGVDGVTVGACSKGTATESGGTVTVTVTGSGTTRKQTTVTITNTIGSTATISFDYSVSNHDSGVSTIDDLCGADSGTYSVMLTAGGTKTFVISSKRGYPFEYTATATLSNFRVEEAAASSNITVTYGSNGSVSIDGTAVSSGTTISLGSTSAHNLVATPVSGASFLGWINAANNELLSTSTTYSLTPTKDMSIQAVFEKNDGTGTAWFLVDNTYLVNNLTTAGSKGTKIVLMNDGTLAAGDYTIASGDTLVIPFDDAGTVFTTNHQTGSIMKDNSGLVAGNAGATGPFRTLTMTSGANITVNGNLCLPAKLSATSGADYNAGSPIGKVPYIVMQGTSNITLNNGAKLYCYGFITGSGSVTVNSGATVYECFQFQDFRGGSCCSALENNKSTYRVFPTSQFFIQNVEVPMTVKYGGTLFGVSAVNVSMVNEVYMNDIGIIGTSGAMFSNSGDVTMRYDGNTDRLIVDINGNAALGGITLDFAQLGASIASSDYVLGLCNNMTVNINSGTTTSNQKIALQAGVEVNIAEGAGLVLNQDMHVYDSSEWGQFCFSSSLKGIVDLSQIADAYKSDISANENYGAFSVSFAPGKKYTRTWSDLKDAIIDVNGTLTATSANLYTTESGASIISSKGTGKVNLSAGSQTIAYQIEEVAGGDWDKYEIPITPAQLKNADGSYLQSGTNTYTYDSAEGEWRCAKNAETGEDTHTGVDTDHECDVCGYVTSCSDTDDHNCDICGKEDISDCADNNGDSVCDICGASLCEHGGATKTEAAATCVADGHKAHWTCGTCGKSFSDEGCTTEITDLTAWLADSSENGGLIPALGHDYTNAEITYTWEGVTKCTASRDCQRDNCDFIETAVTETIASEEKTPATCVAKGWTTYTATFEAAEEGDWAPDANSVDVEDIDIDTTNGHTYGDPVFAWNEANTVATASVSCSVCEDNTTNKNKPLEVTMSSETVDGTCQTEAKTTYTASTEWNGKTVTDSEVHMGQKDANKHTKVVTDEAVTKTCTTDGKTEGSHCDACGVTIVAQEVIPANGHDYSAVVTAPTCTEQGYTTYTCSVCSNSEVKDHTDALNHLPGDAATCATPQVCTREGCGATLVEATGKHVYNVEVANTRVPATCEAEGSVTMKCATCDGTQVQTLNIDMGNHTGKNHIVNAKSADCVNSGYTGDTVCECGVTVEYGEVIPATGHNYEAVVTAPTCTEDGYTTYTCSKCGHSYVADTVAAQGHSYNSVVTAPTCTEAGYTTHTCTVCGDTHTDSATDALGHAYGDGVVTTKPTCEDKGEKTFTCGTCGDTKTEEIAATGHNYEAVVTLPTCSEAGYTTYTCKNDSEHTYVADEVAALGHTEGEVVIENNVAADCVNKGSYDEVIYCTVCKVEVSRNTVVVPATGHKEGEVVVENKVAADCTKDGSYDNVVYCTVCDTELSRDTVSVDALGHDEVNHDAKAPTCTEIGWDAYVTCKRDGCNYTTYVEKAKTGHNYNAVVTAPDCTEEGYTTHTCSKCGDTYTDSTVPATGHVDTETKTVQNDDGKTHTTTVTCSCGVVVSTDTANCVDSNNDFKCDACGELLVNAYTDAVTMAEEYDGTKSVDGTTVTLKYTGKIKYLKAAGTGAWNHWVGFKITAPAGVSLNNIKILRPDNETRIMANIKDGDNYAYLYWGMTEDEDKLAEYKIDWNGDSTYDLNVVLDATNAILLECEHAWGDGVVTTEPTCTEAGEKTYTCANCGGTKTEVISKLNHVGTATTTNTAQIAGTETHATTVTCECGHVISTTTPEACDDNNSDGKCDVCEGTVAPKGYQVKFDDREVISKDTATIDGLVDDGSYAPGHNFTVTSEMACVVAISYDDGLTYKELSCTHVDGNTYRFTIPEEVDCDFKIGFVLRGDATSNGTVDARDCVRISKYRNETADMDALELLGGDATANGTVDARDCVRISKYRNETATIDWK